MKKIIVIVIVIVLCICGLAYRNYQLEQERLHAVIISGNGRLEATEINISAKLAGRIEEIFVEEGDFIKEKQPLVQMQLNVLNAEMAQAVANKNVAITAAASARTLIEVRESEVNAAKAVVAQKLSTLNAAKKTYDRSVTLHKKEVIADQEMDDTEAAYLNAKADYEAAQASLKQAEADVKRAQADAIGAEAAIQAKEADIQRIQADIDDSKLTAPRMGRIQYRIAEPGEVMPAGGHVLNLVDLTDVYMTFYVPEIYAGRIRLGSEVRLLLDALADKPIPAEVSYVASVAQFTPKTVETESERQKMMFRVKARIDRDLLKMYVANVKTGLPGVAWVKLDDDAEWPKFLQYAPEDEREYEAKLAEAKAAEKAEKEAAKPEEKGASEDK